MLVVTTLAVARLDKVLDAGNIYLDFMIGCLEVHVVVTVPHHGPARPKDCLHDDQLLDVGDLDRVDGGHIGSYEHLHLSSSSAELLVSEVMTITTMAEHFLDPRDLGARDCAGDLFKPDSLNLVDVAVDVFQSDLEQVADFPSFDSISSDQNKGDSFPFELELLREGIKDEGGLGAVVKETGDDKLGVGNLDVHHRDDGGADFGAIDQSIVGYYGGVVAVDLIPVSPRHTVWGLDADEIICP